MRTELQTIQHTNYISANPIISKLLNHFLMVVCDLLRSIQAKDKHGLDAGCGEGHMLAYLKEKGVLGHLTVFDINEAYTRFAYQQFSTQNCLVADICNLPFPDNSFDYVISTEVFEHLPQPEISMAELQRVAKPRADFIISVPFEPFFHWGNLFRGKYWYRGGYTPDHRHFWNRHQFRTFLAPFVDVRKEYSLKTFPWLLYGCRFR